MTFHEELSSLYPVATTKKAELQPRPLFLPFLPPDLWGSCFLIKEETAGATPVVFTLVCSLGQPGKRLVFLHQLQTEGLEKEG